MSASTWHGTQFSSSSSSSRGLVEHISRSFCLTHATAILKMLLSVRLVSKCTANATREADLSHSIEEARVYVSSSLLGQL